MPPQYAPRVGGVLSADIAVPEHERVVKFYSRILTTGNAPFWREDLINSRGTPIIGVGERVEAYAHLPLQWMPHIQVADVAASAQRAVDLGGAELMHGKNDDGTSQWAVLADPNGAAFGIIPVVTADQIPPTENVAAEDDAQPAGSIAWLDLTVPDASATRDFYQQVVGWSPEDVAMTDGEDRYADYNMCGDDGHPAAGICHARGMNQALPPVWLIYLPVGDLTESVKRLEESGGRIIHSAQDGDGEYIHAVIEDPVGACLALSQG